MQCVNFCGGRVVKVVDFYNSPYLPIYAVISVLLIYIICSVIELIRIRFIEKPFLKRLYEIRIFKKLDETYQEIWG